MKTFIVGVVVGALLLISGCGDDGPTGPVRPKTYYFYSLDWNAHSFYRFNPESGKLDTVTNQLSASLHGLNISSDGRYLYVNGADGHMAVYSSDSFQFVRSVPYPSGSVAASPDGRLIALIANRAVNVLSLPNYELLYASNTNLLRLDLGMGVFSADSKTLYGIGGDSVSVVQRLQINPSIVYSERAIPSMPGSLVQVVPSVDESLWFLYSNGGSFLCYFGVYDVAKDSLICLTSLSPGHGWIAASADRRNVIFTNPGTLLMGPPPPPAFYIYDIPTNSVKEVPTPAHTGDSTLGDSMPVGPVAVSPDGRTLVAVGASAGLDLLVYDLPDQKITGYFYFQKKAWLHNIECQSGK